MDLAIITSGYLPVPATKGGAVENLVQNLMKVNENKKNLNIKIFSIYEEKAVEEAIKYKETNVDFIKVGKIVKCFDRIIYFIAKNILKKQKTMSYRYILQRLCYLNKVSKKLEKENYDKILLENHATLFLALKWRKNYEKYQGKYYYHVHNEIKSDYGCSEIIKKCKKILCVSNYIKKHVEKRFNITDNIVEKWENCIDTDKFDGQITEKENEELRKKYNIEKDEKILLFTGRLNKEKGIKELLEAISMINESNFKLLIVGSFFFDTKIKNDFEEELEKIINNIKEKVIFTGYVPYEQIQKIYSIADIAVLPSIWDDPAPLTIIEAMSSGLPIITTDSGGIPEYAKNGCAIIIKRNEDLIKNLENQIERLLDNDTRRKQMSIISKENARDLNLENFYYNLFEKIKE